MIRSKTTRFRRAFTTVACLALIALISHMSASEALAFHFRGAVFMRPPRTPSTFSMPVLLAVAAGPDPVTDKVCGVAVGQVLNLDAGETLRFQTEIREGNVTTDASGVVLSVQVMGTAMVTVSDGQNEFHAEAACEITLVAPAVGSSGDASFRLVSETFDLEFSAGPPPLPFFVETPGKVTMTGAAVGSRIGEAGEFDMFGGAVVEMSTGERFGGTSARNESGDLFLAEGDVDDIRVRTAETGTAIEITGLTDVQTREGQCVSSSTTNIFAPHDSSVPGVVSFRAPRCRARMAITDVEGEVDSSILLIEPADKR